MFAAEYHLIFDEQYLDKVLMFLERRAERIKNLQQPFFNYLEIIASALGVEFKDSKISGKKKPHIDDMSDDDIKNFFGEHVIN